MISKKKAFTLIELLVVIVIIAILAAIIILALNKARVRAADSALQDTLSKVAEALAAYRTDAPDDKYPVVGSPDPLANLKGDSSLVVQLPKVTKDAQGNNIGYLVNGDRSGYVAFGQRRRAEADWFFVKDGDKCYQDGLTKPTSYAAATCL